MFAVGDTAKRSRVRAQYGAGCLKERNTIAGENYSPAISSRELAKGTVLPIEQLSYLPGTVGLETTEAG